MCYNVLMKKNRIKKNIIIFSLILINVLLLFTIVSDNVRYEILSSDIETKNESETYKSVNHNIENKNEIVKNFENDNSILTTESNKTDSKEIVEMELCGYTERVINVWSDGDTIYGVALIPDIDNKKFPLVVLSHGLGGSHINLFEYGEYLASRGIATYLFDFTKTGNLSTGDVSKMSILTEVVDLNNILNDAKRWDFVDSNKIILMGVSQGGLVSSIVAKQNEKSVKGLILCYPAFSIPETIHKKYKDITNLSDVNNFEWTMVGKKYITDMWNYDINSNIFPYKNKVLILHGDLDTTVPIRYSELAKDLYKDCDLIVIHRASHIFNGTSFDEAINHIMNYLKEIYIIN